MNAAVPRDLETICLKCLEKLPQRRYPTAQTLAEDLGRFLKQEPILARPASAGRKVEQWVKRHPLLLAGAAALAVLVLAALSYGLWQQNRYLVWHAAHPEAAQVAGPRTAFAKTLDDIVALLLAVMSFAFFLTNTKLRGIPLEQMFEGHRLGAQPVKLLSPWALLLIETISVSGIVFALFYLVKWIDAFVWEGYGRRNAWGTLYLLLYFGGATLLYARRQRRIQLFGQKTQELLDRVVAALRAGDSVQAFKVYREATHCTFFEAQTAIDRIAQQYGLAVPPATIGLTRLAVLFLIECVALAALWFVFPPDWRRPLLAQFAGGWVGGVAIVLGVRLKDPWKRVLVIMPVLIAVISVQVLFSPHHDSVLAITVGVFAGFGLVIGSYRKEW